MIQVPLNPVHEIAFEAVKNFQVKDEQDLNPQLTKIKENFEIQFFSAKRIAEIKKICDDKSIERENKLKESGIEMNFNENETKKFEFSFDEELYSIITLQCIFISWELIQDQQRKILLSNLVLKACSPLITEQKLTLQQKTIVYSIVFHVFHYITSKNALNSLEENIVLFLQLFQQNLSSEYMIIIVYALKVIISNHPNEISPENAHILTLIHQIVSDNPEIISAELLKAIFVTLAPLTYKMNVPVLSLIASLSAAVPEEVGMVAITILPPAVFQYFTTYSEDQLELGFGDFPEIPDSEVQHNADIKLKFRDNENETMSFDSMAMIPEKQAIDLYFSSELISILNLVSKIISANDTYSSKFLDITTKNIIKNNGIVSPKVLLAFIYISRKSLPCTSLLRFVLEMQRSVFFDQRVNIFKQNENALISSVRWTILDNLYLSSSSYILYSLKHLLSKPYIYAETIMRLIQSQQYIDINNKKDFVELITFHSLYFASQKGEAEDIARRSIILLFSRLFSLPEFVSCFFMEEYYTLVYIENVFDSNLKDFVFKSISTYMMTVTELSKCLPSALNTVLQAAISDKTKRGICLCSDLLRTVNSVMAVKKGIDSYLVSMRQTICNTLIVVSNNEASEEALELILQSMQFFIITSPIGVTTIEEVSAFEAASSIFKDDPPAVLFTKTIQLLAGQQLSSFAPIFIVREPKFLRFFLYEYAQTPKFEEAINYIQSLCSFSSQNLIECHEGQLDMYLIDILQGLKAKENVDIKFVTSILDLFTIITSYICSVPVVQRYISLFTPLNKTTVSYLQPTFIKGLITTIQSTVKKPSGLFDLKNDGMIFEIKGIGNELINDGFTYAAWLTINSESSKYRPNIFTLKDSQGQTISVTMNVLDIYINVTTKVRKSDGYLPEQFPLNTWVFLTLVFKKIEEGIALYASFNCGETFELLFPSFEFSGNVTCIVGGVESDGRDPDSPMRMGSFGIFKSNDSYQISSIEAGGPQLDTPTVPHIFILKTSARNTIFTTKFESSAKNISLVTHGNPSRQLSMITDCLVNICGIDIIIPLFSQIDMVFPNGEKFDSCAKLAIELLFTAIANNTESQRALANSKNDSINTIAHLLAASDKANITYSLYSYIFTLFQSLNSISLQKKFTKTILFNFELWYHSNTIQDCNLVLRNWKRNLIPYLRSMHIPSLDVQDLLNTLITFDGDDGIRKLLSDIVVEEAQQDLTQDDLLILISHATNAINIKSHYLLLDIIERLAMNSESLLKLDTSCILNIIYIANCKDQKILLKIVEVLIIFCSKPDISICPLHEALDILLHNISVNNITSDLFDYLLDIAKNGVFGVFPMLTWCSLILGEEYFLRIIEELEPKSEFIVHKMWAVWAVIAAFKYTKISSKILEYLLHCSNNDCNLIDTTIETIGDSIGKDSTELRRNLFIIAADNVENYELFFTRALYFILIHNENKNELLKDIINNSPFAYQSTQKESALEFNFMNPIDFYIFISKFKVQDVKMGVRISKDMIWEDEELAYILLKQFLEHKIPSLLSSMLFLASLILSKREEADKFIEEVSGEMNEIEVLNIKSPQRLLQIENIQKSLTQFFIDSVANEMNDITEFFNATWERSSDIIKNVDKDINKLSTKSIFVYKAASSTKKAECAKSWALQWHSLSTERGIWAIKGDEDANILHWKKTPSPCRMAVNWKFDNHLKASLKRETFINAPTETINEIESKIMHKSQSNSFIFDTEIPTHSEENLQKSKYIGSFDCNLITLTSKKQCILSIYQNGLNINVIEGTKMIIPGHFIKSIEHRKVDHKFTACEIFTWTGKSYFLNFNDLDPSKLSRKLSSVNAPNAVSILSPPNKENIYNITKKWMQREMTNYDYILALNELSGRSFNVLCQYPIFPWVLTDYESEELDFNNKNIYRDLSRPPGIITDKKKILIKENGDQWEYSSSMLAPSNITSFLVRTEPFTTIRIKMNGGSFDLPNSIFSSIKKEWDELSINENDTRELIPEFFSMPEFLKNENNFDLGSYKGTKIGDVILPPYAHDDAMEFIYLHRKALESDYVSDNLCNWIDLNFGCKQRGQEAYDSCNKYKDEMYEDAYEHSNEKLVIACMENLGQIPSKLFNDPHVKRWFNFSDSIQLSVERIRLANAINGCLPISSFGALIRNEKDISVLFEDRILIYKLKKSFRNKSVGNLLAKKGNKKATIKDITTSKETEMSTKMLSDKIDSKAKVCKYNGMFVVSKNETQTIGFIGKQNSASILGNITSLSSSGPIICVGTGAATANVFIGEQLDELCTVQAFKSEIVCTAVSSKYYIVALGTADGALVISALDNKMIIRSVDMGSIPQKILITDSFGFIAVFSSLLENGKTTYFISLFNVNGTLIRRREIDFQIAAWNSYISTHSGVDIIVLADDSNRLYELEAYTLDIKSPFYQCSSNVIDISLMKNNLLVTSNNCLEIIEIR